MLPNIRNPRINSRLNPNINSRINPRINSLINPNINSRINPRFNSVINPRFNSSLNPRFNARINYRFNSRINPRFNSQINPRFNVLLNPKRAVSFLLPAIFELNLNWTLFAVPLPDDVEGYVVFDKSLEIQYFAHSNKALGYNLFNIDNEWIGYWVPTDIGFAEYGLMGNWMRFVVV